MTTRRKPPHAFTLVELLVVIGIIAILIGLLLPVLAGVQARGRDIKCQANLRSIVQAMYAYAAENGHVYLDYFSATVGAGGLLRPELNDDGLHPNAKGYAVMAPLAEKAIAEALRRPAP